MLGLDRAFSLSVYCNQQGGFGVENTMKSGRFIKKSPQSIS